MTTRNIERRSAGDRPHGRRVRGDDGSALVEFALIGPLLLLILFGIINFGLILSFKQDVTRAAAEGARGGAVAVPLTAGQDIKVAAKNAADSATNDAVKQIGGRFKTTGCTSTPGLSCSASVVQCASQTAYNCVTVTVDYDYDNNPLYGALPFFKPFFPNQVKATSVARING